MPLAGKVWADDPATGKRRDLELEEDHAFWAWAIVEVLRATGVRVEELLELSHYSFVQYRLPTTDEIVPVLQIVPSNTDEERLLLVSPELADVLSAVIHRVRDNTGKIPLITSYDWQECVWLPPSPLLFQRRFGAERRRISPDVIRDILAAALVRTGLTDPSTGEPLRFTPHDFRRLFITDAIMSGLPPHIAQVIAGHGDINVTMGYKAVYPDEAIQSHLAFLSRRRAMRPTEEYRSPTDAEWQEFLGHFERRKVSTGICGRAVGTPCVHEHSCLRCSMHWPDPAQRQRIAEIRLDRPHRRSRTRRLAWRSRRTPDQPRRGQRQTRPNRPALDRHRCRPRPAQHTAPENLMDATPFLVQRSWRLPLMALRIARTPQPTPPTDCDVGDGRVGIHPN